MSDLPPGWVEAELNDLGAWRGGGTPSKRVDRYWVGDIPWVSPKDMKVERIRDTLDHISVDAVHESSTSLIPTGSVLVVTRSGILSHTLPVAVVEREVALNQDLKALVATDGVVPEYVAWSLRANAQRILRECSKAGTTVANIETSQLLAFRIGVAPLNEQRRIVVAIEEHLSRLDAADASLAEATKRADAFERSTIAAVADGHELVELGGVTTAHRYGTSVKCRADADGPAVLRIPNVRDGRIDTTDLKFATTLELGDCHVESGDLLFVRTNGSRDLIGRVAAVDGAAGMAFASYLIRARPTDELDAKWAVIALSSPRLRSEIESRAASTAGQYNLNLKALRSLKIPLPPLEEQRRIVAEVEERLGAIDALRAAIERAQRRGAALRRLILERAFRGELVPQDPSDEPASVLFDRIRADRAAQGRAS